MSLIVKQTQLELREKILDALGRAIANGELPAEPIPDFIIEKPSNSANGDFSTNVAMAGAKAFKKAPRIISENIVNNLFVFAVIRFTVILALCRDVLKNFRVILL